MDVSGPAYTYYNESNAARRVSSKTFMLATIDGLVWRLANTFASKTRDVAEIEKVHGD